MQICAVEERVWAGSGSMDCAHVGCVRQSSKLCREEKRVPKGTYGIVAQFRDRALSIQESADDKRETFKKRRVVDKTSKFLLVWGEENYREVQGLNLPAQVFREKNEKRE